MKILIVEDSLFVRRILQKTFAENISDCEIFLAEDGKKGLELYNEKKPDFITTDLLMPNLNGQEMLAEIRKVDDTTPVVVISADVQNATREEVENLGISHFINKPMTKDKSALLIDIIKGGHHA